MEDEFNICALVRKLSDVKSELTIIIQTHNKSLLPRILDDKLVKKSLEY